MIILYVAIGFLCGSLMFSYWLGLAVKKDIRTVGDGTPGAFNLWHVAGYKLGILGVVLDLMKGYLPLFIMIEWGVIKGPAIVPVAIAPILGHALSPFMKFRGGKSIAVTFGVWSAVTNFEISVVYAMILAVLMITVKLLRKGKPITSELDGFLIVIGMLVLGVYLVLRAFPFYIIILWAANLLILIYTNKIKLYNVFKTFNGSLHKSA